MLKYRNFTVIKIEEKPIFNTLYYDLIIVFDKYKNHIFEITNVHINKEGTLISTLAVFCNKKNGLELIPEETKEFEGMRTFIEKFLRKYFMEQK